MSLDVFLLISGGLVAILAGGLVAFQGPARYASLLAAAALASLGVLQFGWARALYEITETSRGAWFELSLALALPVSLCWLLLSLTLLRESSTRPPLGWRLYIVAQSLASVAALAIVAIVPAGQALEFNAGDQAFPLRPAGSWMLAGILVNLVLLTANFESTYLSLPRGARTAFRPGLLGILLCTGYFAYVSASSLFAGRVYVRDVSFGAFAVIGIAFLLPLSLLPGKILETRARRTGKSVTSTASFVIAIGFLSSISALAWIVRLTGWSPARALWMLVVVGAALGIAALAVSNRLQRRFQRFVDPYLHRKRADRRAIAAQVTQAISHAHSLAELCNLIPSTARDLIGAEPVTLFIADERNARFVVAASTLDPAPLVSFTVGDPLATELRRAGHAIRLRGRPDDLEYIPIYVENAVQITACAAECAAPITLDDELFAILLCGERATRGDTDLRMIPLLDLACRRYTAQLEQLTGSRSHKNLPES